MNPYIQYHQQCIASALEKLLTALTLVKAYQHQQDHRIYESALTESLVQGESIRSHQQRIADHQAEMSLWKARQ